MMRDITPDERDIISHAAAEVEIVEKLKRLLEQGTVLSMRDAESLYTETLKEKGIPGLCSRKSIKKFLQDKIPELEFILSPIVNQPDMSNLPEARSNAAKALAIEQTENWVDQLKMMFKVAKIIRS